MTPFLLQVFESRLLALRTQTLPARDRGNGGGGGGGGDGETGTPRATVIRWEESFKPNLMRCCMSPKDTILQFWKHPNTQKRGHTVLDAVRAGYEVIVASERYWYLDPQEKFVKPWPERYRFDPLRVELLREEDRGGRSVTLRGPLAELVRGGEVACWGHCMASDASFQRNAIVPLITAAERLWSPKHVNDEEEARPRLQAVLEQARRAGLFDAIPPLGDFE